MVSDPIWRPTSSSSSGSAAFPSSQLNPHVVRTSGGNSGVSKLAAASKSRAAAASWPRREFQKSICWLSRSIMEGCHIPFDGHRFAFGHFRDAAESIAPGRVAVVGSAPDTERVPVRRDTKNI